VARDGALRVHGGTVAEARGDVNRRAARGARGDGPGA
jgi:hypothetical protein